MLKTIWISLLAFALGVWGVNTLFRREVRTDELPSASEQTNGIAPNAPYTHLDTYLERQLAALNVPGAALAVVEGEEIVHVRAFGRAGPDGQTPTPQTPFFIGSLTKSVTAVAILQLAEAGKVELDAPVQRYLPWFRVADPQATAQMTVRCLLNQTRLLPAGPYSLAAAQLPAHPTAAYARRSCYLASGKREAIGKRPSPPHKATVGLAHPAAHVPLSGPGAVRPHPVVEQPAALHPPLHARPRLAGSALRRLCPDLEHDAHPLFKVVFLDWLVRREISCSCTLRLLTSCLHALKIAGL
jgi:hypothetical protein